MRGVLVGLTMLVVAGCGSEAVDPSEPSGVTVYVGTATGSETSQQTLVALAIRDGHARFFACGDEDIETTTVWVDVYDVDLSPAESPLESDGTAGWQLEGIVSSGWARGSVTRATHGEALQWEAQAVPSDDPGGPGLYTDGGTCETGVIVSDTIQGSYCASEYRAQVDPLGPSGDAWSVHLVEMNSDIVVQRVFAQ